MLHCARQAWRLLGWGERGGHLWGNVVEPDRFSSAGRRLAVVIWVHYVSKVLPCSKFLACSVLLNGHGCFEVGASRLRFLTCTCLLQFCFHVSSCVLRMHHSSDDTMLAACAQVPLLLCQEVVSLAFASSGFASAHTMALLQVYEFTDTAIMVLKKNNRQITLLHVYHHASTFFPCWWSAVNFAPGGDVWFLCALNSSVHVAMCATPT